MKKLERTLARVGNTLTGDNLNFELLLLNNILPIFQDSKDYPFLWFELKNEFKNVKIYSKKIWLSKIPKAKQVKRLAFGSYTKGQDSLCSTLYFWYAIIIYHQISSWHLDYSWGTT